MTSLKSVRIFLFQPKFRVEVNVYLKPFSGFEICSVYNVDDAEEFVERWMSFSISSLGGDAPSIATLADFENKEFKNALKKSRKLDNKDRVQLKVYNQDSDDEENELLGAYVCITPKVSQYFYQSMSWIFSWIFSLLDDKKLRDRHNHKSKLRNWPRELSVTKRLSCKLSLN